MSTQCDHTRGFPLADGTHDCPCTSGRRLPFLFRERLEPRVPNGNSSLSSFRTAHPFGFLCIGKVFKSLFNTGNFLCVLSSPIISSMGGRKLFARKQAMNLRRLSHSLRSPEEERLGSRKQIPRFTACPREGWSQGCSYSSTSKVITSAKIVCIQFSKKNP